MAKIILVRHGQDEDNAARILNGRRDRPLTDIGREQARATAEKLREHQIDLVYTSPQRRAWETATIIADALGTRRPARNSLLMERDFGILTGKPIADIPKHSKRSIQVGDITYFLEAEGAEDFFSVYWRAGNALRQIQFAELGRTCLVVAHGDITKMMRGAFHGWGWEKALQERSLQNAGVLVLDRKGPEHDIFK